MGVWLQAFANAMPDLNPSARSEATALLDVSLAVGDALFRAHKCVLGARSSLFASYMHSAFTESKSAVWAMDESLSPDSMP